VTGSPYKQIVLSRDPHLHDFSRKIAKEQRTPFQATSYLVILIAVTPHVTDAYYYILKKPSLVSE
jgi:hypothetical protein